MGEVSGWANRVRAVVEKARTFVRSADEFPPEDVGDTLPWDVAFDFEALRDSIDEFGSDEDTLPYSVGQAWEYHTTAMGIHSLTTDITDTLAVLGREGWELVSMCTELGRFLLFVFKRPAKE